MTGDGVADPTTTLAAHPSVYDALSKVLFCCNPDCVAKELRFERPIDHAAHVLAVLAEEGWAVVPHGLLADLTDPDDCWFDHHGACQAHGCAEPPCPHQRAKDILNTKETR